MTRGYPSLELGPSDRSNRGSSSEDVLLRSCELDRLGELVVDVLLELAVDVDENILAV